MYVSRRRNGSNDSRTTEEHHLVITVRAKLVSHLTG